jgi:hypothetical protein
MSPSTKDLKGNPKEVELFPNQVFLICAENQPVCLRFPFSYEEERK